MVGISYPLAIPNTQFPFMVWGDASVVGMSRSPFTGSQEVQEHQGQWWEVEISFLTLERPEAEQWATFRNKLNGRFGTFLMGDPTRKTPRGSAAVTPGTPVVDGAGQVGNILDLKGLPASANGYLLEGDLIQLGTGLATRLHRVLDPVDTDAGGLGSALIWPLLRESPADGAPLIVQNTVGIWRQSQNRVSVTREPGGNNSDAGMLAIEAL